MSFLPLFLQAGTAAGTPGAAGAAAGAGLSSFIIFIPLLLIMYFLILRPQNKKQKEMQKMLDALKKGDKVITIGGIHGTVSGLKDDTVTVKVDEGCRIEFNRTAIASVVGPKPLVVESKDGKKEKDSKSGSGPDKNGDTKDKNDE